MDLRPRVFEKHRGAGPARLSPSQPTPAQPNTNNRAIAGGDRRPCPLTAGGLALLRGSKLVGECIAAKFSVSVVFMCGSGSTRRGRLEGFGRLVSPSASHMRSYVAG